MVLTKSELNKLRCPVCNGQIDGTLSSYYVSELYCATHKDHYKILYKDGSLFKETVSLYDYKKLIKYSINKNYSADKFTSTKIIMDQIDAEGRVIFTFEENSFTTNIDIFDFKKFNCDNAINRIKTVLLFQ